MNLTTSAGGTFSNSIQNEAAMGGGSATVRSSSVQNVFSNVTPHGIYTVTDETIFTENISSILTLVFTSTSYSAYWEKVLFCAIGLIGFIGNSLVIFVFLRSPNVRRKTTNILILHQSFIDLLASIFLVLNHWFDDMGWIKEPGPLAYYFCKLWVSKYSLWTCIVVSTFNLVALTLERYLALMYPISYKRYFTRSGVLVIICLSWIIGSSFMSFVIWTTTLKETLCSTWTEWPSQMFKSVFGVIVLFVELIIPFCILSYCYGRIALMIHRSAKMKDASQHREKQMVKARVNVIRTLLLVSVSCFVCWTPGSLYYLLHMLGIPVQFTSPMYKFSVIACFANCCINPFIYVFSYEAFQKGMKTAFCCRIESQEGTQPSAGTTDKRMIDTTTVGTPENHI